MCFSDSQIEIINSGRRPATPRVALFDFDGTISLIREGWQQAMVPMFVDALIATGTCETPDALDRIVREFIMELTGKQTIYQMIRLTEEIENRGGTPLTPIEYKRRYHALLDDRIRSRKQALRDGQVHPDTMLVPYCRQMLADLRDRSIELYLASGTDEVFVREEIQLLNLGDYFGERIFGAVDDFRQFSKAQVIQDMMAIERIDGSELVGFGDGFVEIENTKQVGGLAIAVASDEANRSGHPDTWKRERLLLAGADVVIPDFREYLTLNNWLFD